MLVQTMRFSLAAVLGLALTASLTPPAQARGGHGGHRGGHHAHRGGHHGRHHAAHRHHARHRVAQHRNRAVRRGANHRAAGRHAGWNRGNHWNWSAYYRNWGNGLGTNWNGWQWYGPTGYTYNSTTVPVPYPVVVPVQKTIQGAVTPRPVTATLGN